MALFSYRLSVLLGGGGSNTAEAPGGTPIAQIFYVAGFASALLAIDPLKDFRRLLVLPITVIIALAWCWLSITWSVAPPLAMRRLFLVSILLVTVFLTVREMGYPKALSLLRFLCACAIVISLILIFAVPDLGIQPASGTLMMEGATQSWRGVMVDKNAFGGLAAIAFLAFVADNRFGSRAYRWIFAILSFACLVGSLSKTALAVIVVVTPLAFAISRVSPARRVLWIPIAMFVAVGLVLLRHELVEPFSSALTDPRAFTGRGVIWGALWPYLQSHSMFGAGFGSFWSVGTESPIFRYSAEDWVLKISQGHNGYLDLAVTIGVPGLILAVLAFFLLPLFRAIWTNRIHPNEKFFVISVLLFCISNNFTESTLLNRDTLLNITTFLAVAVLHAGVNRRNDPVRSDEVLVTPTPLPIGLDVVLARNARVEAEQGSGERPVARDPFAHVDMPGRIPHPPRGREPDDIV